ncbi:hypothetical protein CHISP_3429 [Chitinispirillum alkaliphilum]|nr:hypothetical protein CHISP_3429 [Chitinispirillum alkaliphilum]
MKDVYGSDSVKDPERTAYIGVAEAVLGLVIVVLAIVATDLMILILGIVLIVRGVLDGLEAYRNRHLKGYNFRIAVSFFSGLLGVFLILFPQIGAAVISLFIAALIVLEGIRKLSSAFVYRGIKWRHEAVSGLLSLALGIIVFSQWPVVSFWLLGVLVGVEFVLNGWAKAIVGLAQRDRAATSGKFDHPARAGT